MGGALRRPPVMADKIEYFIFQLEICSMELGICPIAARSVNLLTFIYSTVALVVNISDITSTAV